MSVNFSQNPEMNMPQQGNFGANIPTPEPPMSYSILKSMELPTNKDELIRWLPYFVPAVGASKWISHLATNATRLNPKNNSAVTAAESFNRSTVSRMTAGVDRFVAPITTRYASQINSTKSFLGRITPQWFKNLGEKIKIGVTPRNGMALNQYKGMTVMQLDNLLGKLRNLNAASLPNAAVATELAQAMEIAGKDSVLGAKKAIEVLEKLTVDQIKGLKSTKGKSLHVLEELTKSKAFLGASGKTAIGKGIQRGFMMVSEAAGGGVVGASWLGMIMNSIFLAHTFKRTWNAPWGEKLSTFMEGALVDFCGGYLMMLLGTKLTYKLLGFKNVDKSASQLKQITRRTNMIKSRKELHSLLKQTLKQVKAGKQVNSEVLDSINKYFNLNLSSTSTKDQLVETLDKTISKNARRINTSIERLKGLRGLKKVKGVKGFFVNNFINRPMRWVGNFLSVGLENLPENVVGETVKKGKVKNISSLRVFWQHFKNSFKTVAGYPMRFLLVTMIVTPPLTKLCAKVSHTLFGKPTKSIMDEREGKAEKDKEQAQAPQNPYHVDMDTFSNYTKATAIARALAEAQQMAQAQGQLKDTYTPVQRVQENNSPSARYARQVSPATYVPSSAAVPQDQSPISEEIQYQAAQADKLANYAQRGLAEVKRGVYAD